MNCSLFSMTKRMIDQFFFAFLIESPETSFSSIVFPSCWTDKVTIQTEIMTNWILQLKYNDQEVERSMETYLPTPIVVLVVRILSRNEIVNLTQCHLLIRSRSDCLNNQLSVRKRWFIDGFRWIYIQFETIQFRICTGINSNWCRCFDEFFFWTN